MALRLYLVEDSPALNDRIRREVEQLPGVRLLGCASEPANAIVQIRRIQPDVVILDLQLAGGSGLDVLRDLTDHPAPPVTLVFTNHSDSVSRELSLRAGAAFFFDKSTQLDELLTMLSSMAAEFPL